MSQTQSSAATLDAIAGTAPAADAPGSGIAEILATHTTADPAAPAPEAPKAPAAPAAEDDEDASLTLAMKSYFRPREAAPDPDANPPATPKEEPKGDTPGAPPPPPANATKADLADYAKRVREDGYETIADAFEALAARIPKGTDPAEVKKLVAEEIKAARETERKETEHRQQVSAYAAFVNSTIDELVTANPALKAIFGQGKHLTKAQMQARLDANELTPPMVKAALRMQEDEDPVRAEKAKKITGKTILARAAREYARLSGVDVPETETQAPAPGSTPKPRDPSGRFAPNPEPKKDPKDMTESERFEAKQAEIERQRAESAQEISAILKKHEKP